MARRSYRTDVTDLRRMLIKEKLLIRPTTQEHEMDWFEKLTGFRESDYDVTRSRLEVVGGRLHSKVNGQSYAIGNLETRPSRSCASAHNSLWAISLGR